MTTNRKECALNRQKCAHRTLGEAVHCVARHSGIDARHLADEMDVGYATFIRWTESNGLCQMPARKLAQLAQITGRFDHIAWLAADAGLVVARRMEATNTAERLRELLDIADHVGRLAAADRAASADGTVDDEERRGLRGICQGIARELSEYEQALG